MTTTPTILAPPPQQQLLGYAVDPQSALLAQALASMGKPMQQPVAPGSAMAQALLQRTKQQMLQQQSARASAPQATAQQTGGMFGPGQGGSTTGMMNNGVLTPTSDITAASGNPSQGGGLGQLLTQLGGLFGLGGAGAPQGSQ